MSDIKFRVTYHPEGVDDAKSWELDVLDDLKASELIALKKASAGSISGVGPLILGLGDMDAEAIKGIVWIMLKRSMSTLSWEALDFPLGAATIEPMDTLTPGQTRARLEALRAQSNLSPAGEKALQQLVDAGVEPEPEPVENPKA